MTKEQKKAIKVLEHYKNILYICNYEEEPERTGKAIEIVLNLIQEQEKEIEKKDKQIDLMAKQLSGLIIFDIDKEEPLILEDKEEVKEYFERNVKDESNEK